MTYISAYEKIRSLNEVIELDDEDFEISDSDLDVFVDMLDFDELDADTELDDIFEEYIAERKPLNVQQRIKLGRRMKRLAPRLKRKREIAKRRMAPPAQLDKRSRKAAIRLLRKRFAGKQGEKYASLSATAKMSVDKIIQKKMSQVGRISKRLLPKIRKAEAERLKQSRGTKNEAVNLVFESLFNERTDSVTRRSYCTHD